MRPRRPGLGATYQVLVTQRVHRRLRGAPPLDDEGCDVLGPRESCLVATTRRLPRRRGVLLQDRQC
jgi:hypothetical protein